VYEDIDELHRKNGKTLGKKEPHPAKTYPLEVNQGKMERLVKAS